MTKNNNASKNSSIRKSNPVKNVFKLFLEDQKKLLGNVIGFVVLMGLVIVPSMYAWFNIAGSWDPYGSTDQLKVAIVNQDKGYSSDLISVPVNVGNTVEASLRKNKKLNWQFVSKEKAIDGVKSGSYYAAIIIPRNFSAKMMTILSPQASQAHIAYYINEKSNAIAPKITQKAANTVVTQISTTFSKSIANIALDLADSIDDFSTSTQGKSYVNTAVDRMNTVADDLDSMAAQIGVYAQLLQAGSGLVESSQNIISSATSGASSVRSQLNSTVANVKTLASATESSADSVSKALSSAGTSLDAVVKQLDQLSSKVSDPTSQLTQTISTLGTAVSNSSESYTTLIAALQNVSTQINSSTALSSDAKAQLNSSISSMITQLTQASQDVQSVGSQITASTADVSTALTTISSDSTNLKKQIQSIKQTLSSVKSTYNSTVKPQITALAQQLNKTVNQARTASASAKKVLADLKLQGSGASTKIQDIIQALSKTQSTLSDSASSLRKLATRISKGVNSGTATLKNLTSTNTSAVKLAAELSAPVTLQRNAVYAIANYGSSMAAFYTTLAIWVGSVFLVALMKTSVSDRKKATVLGISVDEIYSNLPKNSGPETAGNASRFGFGLGSEYWGRYLTFLLISLLQSTLLVMGDLWYLGIQCVNPIRLFLVAWVASFVFSTIMYALTVAFGAVGKAIAVILMVMQIAGSGGTFPVELLPSFFQHVYPLLPFPYALRAMHAAIAGSYHNEYWAALGSFALFAVPALIIGLVIARPLARSNWVVEQLSKTGVYGE